jgi:LuxR family maltose regulon positive regulatory protein
MWINGQVKAHSRRSITKDRTQTDVGPPDHGASSVDRPRLRDLLDRVIAGKLTVLSAPAGWGKTTLLRTWARGPKPLRLVWWTPAGGHGLVAARRDGSTGHVPVEILDEVPRRSDPPVLVVIDGVDTRNEQVLAAIDSLIRDPGLRVVLSCRHDPPLPLYELRMRNELTSIGPEQLAFTRQETAAVLAAHEVAVGEAALSELHAGTEGWPAAVRLGALAAQNHADPERALAAFVRYDGGLNEYMASEVVGQLDRPNGDVLEQVSVLDRLTPELIEHVTGRPDGAELLREWERAHVVWMGGDEPEPWHRFHPLLGPLLYNQMRTRDPELARELHARASRHFERGPTADAIRHALVARDWSRAAALVRAGWPTVLPGGRRRLGPAAMLMPPADIERDPWLALAFAAERLDATDPEGSVHFIRVAEGRRTDRPNEPATDELGHELAVVLTGFRIAQAYLSEDVRDTAATGTGPDEPVLATHPRHPGIDALSLLAIGATHLSDGQVEAAEPYLLAGLELSERYGMSQVQIAALRHLAVLNMMRATLHAAEWYSRRTLDLANRHSVGRGTDAFWAELVLAEVCHQQDRMTTAEYHLERALGVGCLTDATPAGMVAMVWARIGAANGQAEATLAGLAAARRQLAVAAPLPALARSVVLAEAQLSLACGQSRTALRLLDEYAVDGPLPAWSAVIRARLHLGEGRLADAAAVLTPYLETPQPSRLWQVEANLLHAQATVGLGERAVASVSLERALAVAEEEGIRRPFTDLGAVAPDLLNSLLPANSQHWVLADRILAHLSRPLRPAVRPAMLDENLTSRELTVLRYLQSMMSTAEIAETLYLSVNTVKTHVKRIYRKLGAGRRREAIERAHELHLL